MYLRTTLHTNSFLKKIKGEIIPDSTLSTTHNIFIIAGEKSGDDIGGKLMKALLKQNSHLKFHGIAGSAMSTLGLQSIFPMETLSIMGFWEVLPKIFELMHKINVTVSAIMQLKPDILITIDLPGINYRVTKKLRDLGYSGKIIHYVAPTVWAYKPERAKKFAKVFDLMICILPFETKYFTEIGMKAIYVGNPVIEQSLNFKNRTKKVKKILVLPGSRKQELKILLPIYRDALEILSKKYQFKAVILNFPENISLIEQIFSHSNFEYEITTPADDQKLSIMNECDLALSKSGTITTEIALAGVPMILAHKINALSFFIIKRLIKISQICLINIIAGKKIVPELIQNDCNPVTIAELLSEYCNDSEIRKKQIKDSYKIFQQLGLGEQLTPSDKAANAILKEVGLTAIEP